jgi:hypothetical protein
MIATVPPPTSISASRGPIRPSPSLSLTGFAAGSLVFVTTVLTPDPINVIASEAYFLARVSDEGTLDVTFKDYQFRGNRGETYSLTFSVSSPENGDSSVAMATAGAAPTHPLTRTPNPPHTHTPACTDTRTHPKPIPSC